MPFISARWMRASGGLPARIQAAETAVLVGGRSRREPHRPFIKAEDDTRRTRPRQARGVPDGRPGDGHFIGTGLACRAR
jgi:hypothetical protein